jgi:hypothetical protein
MTDAVGHLVEQATYCRPDDEKRPSLVGLPDFTTQQVCPEELSDTVPEVDSAYPDGWYVRIMFDELLDTDIETLTEVLDPDTGEPTDTFVGSIATTKPVKLECESVNGGMVNVDYDGYYSPSGNKITWPVGPSLVVKPNDPTLIATNTTCQITINENVVDKGGVAVDAAQRGPYKFKIAPISVLAVDPSDDPDEEAPIDASLLLTDGFYVQFNTTVDPGSFCDDGPNMDQCEFTVTPDPIGFCSSDDTEPCLMAMNGTDCATAGDTCVSTVSATSLVPYGFTDTEFAFGPAIPAETEKAYTFAFKQGGKIADRCGKETTFGAPSADDLTQVHVITDKFKLKTTSIATGETASAMKKLQFTSSSIIDPASLDANEYSITPAPTSAVVDTLGGNDLAFLGYYKINTEYTFTLNAGATLEDFWGATYTNATTVVVKWKTQPAITASLTADNTTFTKATATSLVGPTITFNAPMKIAGELTEGTEFTVTDSAGANVTGFTIAAASASSCTIGGTSCALTVRKDLAPGAYKFTLKAGATVTDQSNDVYTQAADKVVNFTVKAPATPTPPPACL